MRVLIGCECSGVVREAFRKLGHDAWSCDLLPAADGSRHHFQGDLLSILGERAPWDMLIAHPPCDWLATCAAWAFKEPDFEKYPKSGYHQKPKAGTLMGRDRREAQEDALRFFAAVMNADIDHICVENPVGVVPRRLHRPLLSSKWLVSMLPGRKTCPATQVIQPYEFGDDASKSTCLWLKGLRPLKRTNYIRPRMVCGCGHTFRSETDDPYGCPNCKGKKTALPRWANQTDSGQNRLAPSEDRASVRAVTYQGIANAMAAQWGAPPTATEPKL